MSSVMTSTDRVTLCQAWVANNYWAGVPSPTGEAPDLLEGREQGWYNRQLVLPSDNMCSMDLEKKKNGSSIFEGCLSFSVPTLHCSFFHWLYKPISIDLKVHKRGAAATPDTTISHGYMAKTGSNPDDHDIEVHLLFCISISLVGLIVMAKR